MTRYRKIPAIIEAVQLTQDMINAHVLDDAPLPDGCRLSSASCHRMNRTVSHAFIRLRNKTMDIVMPGDMVIRDASGEYSVCKPNVFESTYEPVDDASTTLPTGEG